MTYCVRVLATSDRVIPYSEIKNQGKDIRLISGSDVLWEGIEIYVPEGNLISILERHWVSAGSPGESKLGQLRETIQNSYPVSAREWLRKYFSGVKSLYEFQLFGEKISKDGWPVLGRIQNLHKDLLSGIIQADQEGFYNENGDYILWQMYDGASGTIPAAILTETGNWINFQLKLTDAESVGRFKEGQRPRNPLGRLFGSRG